MATFQAQSEHEAKLVDACEKIVAEGRRRHSKGAVDADDVAQDACVRVLDAQEPRSLRDPIRYLFRIARNLVIDRRRKRIREALLSDSLAVIESGSSTPADPERILAGKQDLRRVLSAIESLPPRCREAFTLHRFGGLSYPAIARQMGVSTSMVEKHIAEAMLRVTRALFTTEEQA